MTRLGHQGLTLSRAWIGVDELIGSASERLKRYQPHVSNRPHLPKSYLLYMAHRFN